MSAGESSSRTMSGVIPVGQCSLPEADPYAALDDLMCVVEALCPIWPQRPPTTLWGPAIL
jgi:hypothetical protein